MKKGNKIVGGIISFAISATIILSSEIVEAKSGYFAQINEFKKNEECVREENAKQEKLERIGISQEDLWKTTEDLDISEELAEIIPEDVNDYAESRFSPLVETVKNNYTDFGVNINDVSDLELGEPFVIYSAESLGDQDPIYYYPVQNENKIVLVLFVTGENGEYSAGISTDYVEQLEELDYQGNSDYLFYEDKNGVYAENEKSIQKLFEKQVQEVVVDEEVENVEVFERLSTYNKVNAIVNSYSKNRTEKEYSEEITYTAQGFSSKTIYVVRLNTEGCLVSQGSDKNCWAASVATIVRYLKYDKYKSLTARNVCDKIGVGYQDGGLLYHEQAALMHYGIIYDYALSSQISFARVQQNIQAQKPIIMDAVSSKSGHAVTIIGYTTYGGIKQVTFYNPGSNKVTSVEYKTIGTTFTYVNQKFTWVETLCYK